MQVYGQDSISRNSKIDSTLISQEAKGLTEKANARTYTFLGIKISEPPVQAAFIIAITTLITVILGFIFKDFVIPGWIEKRTKKRESQYLFAKYKNQLFKSSHSFVNRLQEIYRTRSHYLWTQTSMSSFYDYKYKSSIYRLCVLLGWMRAFRLLESQMTVVKSTDQLHDISEGINIVESGFADGQRVEMYVAITICNICNIKSTEIENDILLQFSIEIDDLVQKFQKDHSKKYISDLPPDRQDDFLNELNSLMNRLNLAGIGIQNKKAEIIKEVSIKLALIYRDWQQAIGDVMLIKNSDQSFDVISFKSFEKIWTDEEKTDEKMWLERAERIFEGLDLRVDKTSDSRIEQLERIYISLYSLLDKLYKSKIGTKPVSKDVFNSIPKTIAV